MHARVRTIKPCSEFYRRVLFRSALPRVTEEKRLGQTGRRSAHRIYIYTIYEYVRYTERSFNVRHLCFEGSVYDVI